MARLCNIAVSISMCLASTLAHSQTTLTILHTNSHHGHPLPFFHDGIKDAGGLPARLSVIEKIRKENPNVLLVDAGNINTGNAVSNLFKAKPDVLGYNRIGYDAMAVGHHDFDQGLDGLAVQAKLAAFPFLAANIRTVAGSDIPFFQPQLIKEIAGIKIGIIGLTTPAALVLGNQEMKSRIAIDSPIAIARQRVDALRSKVDFLVLLTNLGMNKQGSGLAQKVAAEVAGIDLVIDGHTMQSLPEVFWQINDLTGAKVPMMKAKFWGLEVGRIDIVFDRDRKVLQHGFSRIPVNTDKSVPAIAQHPDMMAILAPFQEAASKNLGHVIGWNKAVLSEKPGIKDGSVFGNFMADGMLFCLGNYRPDLAVQNGGGIRDQLPQGAITRKDLYSALPFDNSLTIVLQTGQELQELFDRIAQRTPPFGGFPQLANAAMTLDFAEKKAIDVQVGGKKLEPGRLYRVATHSYLANGGDGFDTFKNAEKENTPLIQRDCVEDYITHSQRQIPHVPDQRVRAVMPQ